MTAEVCNVHVYDEFVVMSYPNGWTLLFQRVRYCWRPSGDYQDGFRDMWRRPDGSLQPARGQARIPSLKVLHAMYEEAVKRGWNVYDADNPDCVFYQEEAAA